jgi:hypothetical protein
MGSQDSGEAAAEAVVVGYTSSCLAGGCYNSLSREQNRVAYKARRENQLGALKKAVLSKKKDAEMCSSAKTYSPALPCCFRLR